MKVIDIVINWLKENQYDGLVNIDLECGCGIDDLMPCCDCFSECEPAYKHRDGWFYKIKEGDKDEKDN
jgi:hypothetical protein